MCCKTHSENVNLGDKLNPKKSLKKKLKNKVADNFNQLVDFIETTGKTK